MIVKYEEIINRAIEDIKHSIIEEIMGRWFLSGYPELDTLWEYLYNTVFSKNLDKTAEAFTFHLTIIKKLSEGAN